MLFCHSCLIGNSSLSNGTTPMAHWTRRLFLTLLAGLTLIASPAFPSPIETRDDTLHQAEQQGLLSQRIIKAYTQVLLGSEADKARDQLKAAVARFQEQFDNLRAHAASPEWSAALDEVEELWLPLRATAEGEVSSQGLEQLAEWDQHLLDACGRLANLLAAMDGTSQRPLVRLANHQAMLSQRIAKLYLMWVAGHHPEGLHDELSETLGRFNGGMEQLRAAAESTPLILASLEQLAGDWEMMETTVHTMESGKHSPLTMGIYSEQVLAKMKAIIALYTALPN